MKKLSTLLLLLLISIAGLVQAQTKKSTKTKAPVKKTAAVTTTAKQAAVKPKTAMPKPKATAVKTAETKTKARTAGIADYKTAIGLKFLYGIALTGKHFFRPNHAGEVLVKYRNFTGVASDVSLTALYEYHGRFKDLDGLRWYAGGGGFIGNFSFKEEFNMAGNPSNIYFAVCGVAGLEYKFKNLPLAISADWQPGYMIKDTYNDSGFGADNGGFGIKYTF